MSAFWTAFFLIFAAEMGDKTQFMTLAFSTKYSSLVVISGVTIGTLIVSLLSVGLGVAVGKLLPFFWINIIAGIAFILFAVLSLKPEDAEEDEQKARKAKESRISPVITVASAFLIAEMGDKTMLATVAIASKEHGFIPVWLGSTCGLVAANALAIFAGKALEKYLTASVLRYSIAAIYFISGALAIVAAFRP